MPAPTPNPNSDPAPPDSYGEAMSYDHAMDFRRTWHALLERGWIIVLSVTLLTVAGFGYIRNATVLYGSTASIEVEQDQTRFFDFDNFRIKDVQSLEALQTIVQNLKSRALLERLIDTNNLANDPAFLSAFDGPVRRGGLAMSLDKMITVKLRRGTRLIDITTLHPVPEYTEKIGNSLVTLFMKENAERHTRTTEVAGDSLIKEAERLKHKLQESENALQAYKEKVKATSLDEKQNTIVAKLKELSTRATEAKSQRIKLESDYAQVQKLGSNVELLVTLPSISSEPNILSLQQNLGKAENDFAGIRQRYLHKHPKYNQALSQIAQLKGDLTNAVLKAAQTLKASLDASAASERALDQALHEQESTALELGKLAVQYSVLEREVESDRALYGSVLNRMKETSVTKEVQPNRIRVVQPAYVPGVPVYPRKMLILAFSALTGLFIGVVIVLVIHFMDSSIKTVDEAETLLKLPVLSVVPQMKEVKAGEVLVVAEESHSAGSEAIRTLRTALSMLGREEERRVFLFTSSMPQEGKTFSSINYSASLAQLGHKTLLIDGDLRRPSVEKNLLGQETDHVGVTDYLTGKKTLQEIIRPTKVEKFDFISAGTTAPNPAELLAKDGLSSIIQEALQTYDRVILDTAPIHAVSDTLLMLKSVQTVCLVVRALHTPAKSVVRCAHILQGADAPLAGIIMNRMPLRRRLGYGYSYYTPYYHYHYYGKYSKKGVYGASK